MDLYRRAVQFRAFPRCLRHDPVVTDCPVHFPNICYPAGDWSHGEEQGDMFGSQTFGLKPDILVLAKALSSGYQPISALLINDRMYDVVADNASRYGTFGHGYTYTAHPVAAAVALETLNIYRELDIVSHVRAVEPLFKERLERLKISPLIGDIRQIGLIAGIELVANKSTKERFPENLRFGNVFEEICREKGLILRALGDVIAVAPPLIISKREVSILFERLEEAVKEAEKLVTASSVAEYNKVTRARRRSAN